MNFFPIKPFLQAVLLVVLISFTSNTHAQNTVVIEGIQTYSNIMPNANYWHLKDSRPIVKALETGLFKSLSLQMISDINPIITTLSKSSQLGKITVDWNTTRSIPLHAYVELYEMEPSIVYRNNLVDLPETKKDSIHSIWFIGCTILDQNKNIKFKKTLLMGFSPSYLLGMGYPLDYPVSTAENIFKALAKGVQQLSPQSADMDYLDASLPAAYATDNYWMPYILNQPRIVFDTAKSFLKYRLDKNENLLRVPAASLVKIDLKNKNIDYPFSAIIPYIKAQDKSISNEYYKVYQSLREVNADIDYRVETLIEFEPYPDNQNANLPIRFLNDSLNKIFKGDVWVGNFKVTTNETEPGMFYNSNEIYNGYDTLDKINIGTVYEKRKIIQSSIITGNYNNDRFKISMNNISQLCMFYVNEKVVAIVQGIKKPRQMVLVDKSISTNLLNFLVLFSYSEVFQMPYQY